MTLLENLRSPSDLKKLTTPQMNELAVQIRDFLVQSVAQTGGHLGPNLGVVELTLAMHRIFDSPRDTFIFDTGHQAYVHKILTGRKDFSALRQFNGLSGYPSRAESKHDVMENSHASASLSWADGISRANHLLGLEGHVIAVIGDGAMTGGMAWEALNNIATENHGRLIIVVNDNGRSYAPTIGGLAHHLDALRVNPRYTKMLSWGKKTLNKGGKVGHLTYDLLRGAKTGLRQALNSQAMFDNLGIKYTGPVDGHDLIALEFAFSRLKTATEPVILHVITQKGKGYVPAESHESDLFHSVGPIHPETGLPIDPQRFEWTSVFAEELLIQAKKNPKIVAITAAMLEPVGLCPFKSAFPDRVFDVGIAEQEAVASAAGMAYRGLHPVFAVYSTFLNRAYDQLLMDCALHKAGVTIVEDRSGITGNDGPSHNGMWDIALAATVPGLYLAAPRDEQTLRKILREALQINNAPSVIRYPKGPLPDPVDSISKLGSLDLIAKNGLSQENLESIDTYLEKQKELRQTSKKTSTCMPEPQTEKISCDIDVLLVATGSLARLGKDVCALLTQDQYVTAVVDPGWLLPVSQDLVALSREAKVVITLEDGLVNGGFGSALRDSMAQNDIFTPLIAMGISKEFIKQASRAEIFHEQGLEAEPIVQRIKRHLTLHTK